MLITYSIVTDAAKTEKKSQAEKVFSCCSVHTLSRMLGASSATFSSHIEAEHGMHTCLVT
jgi:hypothetical protein